MGPDVIFMLTLVSTYNVTNFANATTPGHLSAMAETQKFNKDSRSSKHVQFTDRLVPFAIEVDGRIGDHARSLLKEWADRIKHMNKGRRQTGSLEQVFYQRINVATRLAFARATLNA